MAKEERVKVTVEDTVTDVEPETFISVNEMVNGKKKNSKPSKKDQKKAEKAAKKQAKKEAKAQPKTWMKFAHLDDVPKDEVVTVEAEVLSDEEAKKLILKEKEARFEFDGKYQEKNEIIETDFDRNTRRMNEMRMLKTKVTERISMFRDIIAGAQKKFKKKNLLDLYVSALQANIDWLQNVCLVTADRVWLSQEVKSCELIYQMPITKFIECAKAFDEKNFDLPSDCVDSKVALEYAKTMIGKMRAYYEVLDKYPGKDATIKVRKFKEDAEKESKPKVADAPKIHIVTPVTITKPANSSPKKYFGENTMLGFYNGMVAARNAAIDAAFAKLF